MIKSKASFSVVLIFIIAMFLIPFVTASAGTVQLPQTGQTKCYDTAGTQIPCTGTGQDADIQAGVAWPNPRFTDNGDGTVTDNLTGLMWTKDANLPVGTKTWQDALDYVAAMNSGAGTYGHTDWRLPNINELESLVNADVTILATWLNTEGFSNVQSVDYWTSTTSASFTYGAWYVYIGDGYVGYYHKDFNGHVWPVRSGQSGTIELPQTGQTTCYDTAGTVIACAGTEQDGDIQAGVAWPNPRFTDNGDGTVADNLTGLMLTKDANLPGGIKTWQQALDYVAAMNSGSGTYGYTDWRLPNVNEIKSLINAGEPYSDTWLNTQGFSNVQSGDYDYWSSSTYAGDTNAAWYVYMYYGYVRFDDNKSWSKYVWPVRGGQTNENPTAITLSSFKAKQRGRKVLIKWKTASEIDNLGFNILRNDSENGGYTQVNKKLIPAKKNAVSGSKYKLKDRGITKGNTYYYKLEDIDSTSGSTFHDAVEVKVKGKAHKKKNKK